MKQSRIENTIHNTAIGLAGQACTYILTFVYRTIFIMTLGISYLGVQGLFSNVLSVLSLAELGVGSAIAFSLYKPLAENDQETIKSLMSFYAKLYKVIGLIVAGIGLILLPFLSVFIQDQPNIPYLSIIFLLYVSDSVISYFFSYKRTIINADQKGYIDTLNINLFALLKTITQIILLLIFKNFILVLIIQIIFTFLSNASISRKADKLYPYLKDKNVRKLDKKYTSDLFKKIRAMAYHKIGGVVVFSTDNLLISTFVGVYWVGIYSNYMLIITMIVYVIQQFTQSVISSIGNLVSTETSFKSKETFDLLFFVHYWIYGFCSICLITLFNPFITVWIGTNYLFDSWIVMFIVLNFFITGMRQNVLAFRNSLGLFWNDRYKPIFEAIINTAVSIILLKLFGFVGVLIGTLISTLATSFWVEPYILFKHYFKGGLNKYFLKYFYYSLIAVIIAILMQFISVKIFNGTILSFALLAIVCLTLPNLLFMAVFFKTNELKSSISLVKQIIYTRKMNRQNKKIREL